MCLTLITSKSNAISCHACKKTNLVPGHGHDHDRGIAITGGRGGVLNTLIATRLFDVNGMAEERNLHSVTWLGESACAQSWRNAEGCGGSVDSGSWGFKKRLLRRNRAWALRCG